MTAPECLAGLIGKNAYIRINPEGEIMISFPKWITRRAKAGEFTARETAEIKAFAGACGGEITPAEFMAAIETRETAEQVFATWLELVRQHPIEPERFWSWKKTIERIDKNQKLGV